MNFMKRITGAAALGAALLVGAGPSAPPAQAGYVVTLTEQDGNVAASGSGALDVTELAFLGTFVSSSGFIDPGMSGMSGTPGIIIGGTSNDNIGDLFLTMNFNGPGVF